MNNLNAWEWCLASDLVYLRESINLTAVDWTAQRIDGFISALFLAYVIDEMAMKILRAAVRECAVLRVGELQCKAES